MTVKIYGFLGVVNRRTGIIRSEFPLDKQETTIGRQETCDMRLMVANIDPIQAKLVIAEDCTTLYNLSSKDVGVGEMTLKAGTSRQIQNGDVISIGMIHLKYRSVSPANQNMILSIPPTPVQKTATTMTGATTSAPTQTPRKAPALGTPLRTPGTRRANVTSRAQPVQTPKLGTPLRKLVLTKKETPSLGTPRRRPVETPKATVKPSNTITTPATVRTTIPTPKSTKRTAILTPSRQQRDVEVAKVPVPGEIQNEEVADSEPVPPVSLSSLPTSPLHHRHVTTTESILSTPGAPAFEDTIIHSELDVRMPPSPAPMSTGIVLDSQSSLIPSTSDLPSIDDMSEELSQDQVNHDGDDNEDDDEHTEKDESPDDAFEENSFIAWNTSPNSSLVIDLRTMEHFVSEEAEDERGESGTDELEVIEHEDREITPRASAPSNFFPLPFEHEDTPPPAATPAAALKAAIKKKTPLQELSSIYLGDILPPGSSQLTFDSDEIICSSPLPSFGGQEAMDIDGSSYEHYMPELRLESGDNEANDGIDNIKEVDIESVGTPSTDEIIIGPEDDTERAESIERDIDSEDLDDTLEALHLPSGQSLANADIEDTPSVLANTQDSMADTLPLDSQGYTSMFDGQREDEIVENSVPEDDAEKTTSPATQSPVKDMEVTIALDADNDLQDIHDKVSQDSQSSDEMRVHASLTAQAGSLLSSEHVEDSQTDAEDEESRDMPQVAEQNVDERTVHESVTAQAGSFLSTNHIEDSQTAVEEEESSDKSAEADQGDEEDSDKESVSIQELLADSQSTEIDEAQPYEIPETVTCGITESAQLHEDAPEKQDQGLAVCEDSALSANEDNAPSASEGATPVLTQQAEATVAEAYEEVAQEAAAEAIAELQSAKEASPPVIAKRTRGRSRPKETESVAETEAPQTPVPTRRRAASKSVKKDLEKIPARGRQRAGSRSASKKANDEEEEVLIERADVAEGPTRNRKSQETKEDLPEQDSPNASAEEEIVMKESKNGRARSQSQKATSRTPKAKSEETAEACKNSSKMPKAPKKTTRTRKAADETSDKENEKSSSKAKGGKTDSKVEVKEGSARGRRGTNDAGIQSSAERPRRGLRST